MLMHRSFKLFHLIAVAGLTIGIAGRTPALAQDGKDAAAQEAAAKAAIEKAMKDAAAAAQNQAPAQPEAKPIPVPSDLPVISTKDLGEGLIAEELKIGEGYEVKEGGAVVALYHGMLKSDGKVFDSAFERGEPIAFPLSGVIPGWQKGVPGMKVGGIRKLTIPAKLAYGERGAGDTIPPNSDLVFIIQLVDALQYEDITVGEGEEVGPRPVCVTAHNLKSTDGKEIEASSKDKPFVWVPGEFQAMSMVLDGMKVGGKRKITHIPKEMNKATPGAPGNRPADVALCGEVELLVVKNLVPPQPKK